MLIWAVIKTLVICCIFGGIITTHEYVITSHNTDPYEPINTMECQPRVQRCRYDHLFSSWFSWWCRFNQDSERLRRTHGKLQVFFPLQCQQEGGKKGKVSFDLSFKTTRRMWMFWNKSSGIKPYHGTNLRPKLLSFTASKKHKNKIDLPKRQPIFDGFRSTTLVCHEPKIHPNDPTKDREWMREMDENCVCVYLYIYISLDVQFNYFLNDNFRKDTLVLGRLSSQEFQGTIFLMVGLTSGYMIFLMNVGGIDWAYNVSDTTDSRSCHLAGS